MRRAVLAALVAAVLALCSPSSAVAEATPSISLSLAAATIGQTVRVSGQGFPATTSVSVELCGDQAARGTIDCDVLAGQTVVTDEAGAFRSQIVVRFPPVACPCVVWATSNGAATAAATAPIGVVSAGFTNPSPAAPQPTAPSAELEVVHASVRQVHPWRSWLGLPSTDELVVTLRNPGTTAVEHPVVALTVGKGSDPARVVPSPDIDRIAAGAERTVVVPFDVDALTWGRLTVKGTSGSAQPVVFRTHVMVIPWLPPLLTALVLAVPLTVRRRRRRTRRDPERPTDPAIVPTADAIEREPAVDPQPVTVAVPEPMAVADPKPVTVAVPEPAAGRALVTFTWPMWLRAESVAVCGEFNDWSTDSHPLTRLDNGDWAVTVEVDGGRTYRYKFFVDGERWDNDWLPDALMPNEFGSDDSLVVVGFEDRCANITDQQLTRSNGNGNGHPLASDDEVVDLTALDDLSPLNEDFWAEEPNGLWVKLRHRGR